MKIWTRYLISMVLMLILLTAWTSGTVASPVDFSGTWTGPYLYDHEYALGKSGDLTVVMTQTGNGVTGTFETSSGSQGSFEGQVEGTTLALHFTSPVDGQRVSGSFKAEMIEGIIVWEGIGASSGVTQSLRGALAKNWIKDIDRALSLSKDIFPVDANAPASPRYTTGNLWVWAKAPEGETLVSAVLVTPLLEVIPLLEWDEERQRFKGDVDMEVDQVETLYPNGIYTYVIELAGGTRGAYFAGLVGSFPSQYPNVTAPLPGELVDESQPLTLSWDPWTSPGLYTDIAIYFDVDHYQPKQSHETECEIPAFTLPENRWDTFKVEFSRFSGYAANKGIEFFSYIRTAPHVIESQWLGKVAVHLPSGQVGGGLMIGLDGTGIASASLIPPAGASGGPVALAKGKENMLGWQGVARFTSLAQMESAYPDGTYTLRVVYQDTTQEDISLTVSGSYPTQVPEITSPVHLSNLHWWEDIDLAWHTWTEFGGTGNMVNCTVERLDAATEPAYYTADEVWSGSDGMVSDGGTIEPGLLNPGNTYAITPMFVKATTHPGVFKATARAVFVNTAVIPDSRLDVSLSGSGSGMVAGFDGKINGSSSGGTLSAVYNRHEQVVLVAHPDKGSVFEGWMGDPDCADGVVDMSSDKSCIACFRQIALGGLLNILLTE